MHFYLKSACKFSYDNLVNAAGGSHSRNTVNHQEDQKLLHILPVFRRSMCFFGEYLSSLEVSSPGLKEENKYIEVLKNRSRGPSMTQLQSVSKPMRPPQPSVFSNPTIVTPRRAPVNKPVGVAGVRYSHPQTYGMTKFLSLLSLRFPSLNVLTNLYNNGFETGVNNISPSSLPSGLLPPSGSTHLSPSSFASFLYQHLDVFIRYAVQHNKRKRFENVPHYFSRSVITGVGETSPPSLHPIPPMPELLPFTQVFVYDPPTTSSSAFNMSLLSDHLLYNDNIVDEEIIYKLHYNMCYALINSYFGVIVGCKIFGDLWVIQGLHISVLIQLLLSK
jgi:hypothetical protein